MMTSFFPLWPVAASEHAHSVDLLVIAFSVLIVALSAPVFILMAWFAVKYRRGKPADRRHPVHRKTWAEVSWSAIPFFLILGFFVWSSVLFYQLYHPPPDALEINVVAKRWMWKFQHPGGQAEINELHVPTGKPVKLLMTSQDVIHSLYLPALRLKQDVLPDRTTTEWFNADKPGTYILTCAEFCGTDHSQMGGRLIVQTPQDYARWLDKSGVGMSLAEQGEALFVKVGCSGCHSPAATVHAPQLQGLYGRQVPLDNGRTVTADDSYIRDSILEPQKDVAAGYPRIMPTFKNVLSEADISKLIAFIKSTPSTGSAHP